MTAIVTRQKPFSQSVGTPYAITSRLQKGGALLEDMRLLASQWTDLAPTDSPFQLASRILNKTTRARAADTYRRAFLPRFIQGSPPEAWRLAKALENAAPGIDIARPFYYWLTARGEPLLYQFVTEELLENYKSHRHQVRIDETASWVGEAAAATGKRWTSTVQLKVARGLLAALRDFGVLEGAAHKRIAHLHLPLESFCLIAFCMVRLLPGESKLVDNPDWRLFLLGETAVERLLLEAHQRGWLHYQAAGRVRRVEFPAEDFGDYVNIVLGTKP